MSLEKTRVRTEKARAEGERHAGKKKEILVVVIEQATIVRREKRKRETSKDTILNFSTMPHLPGRWSKTDATLSPKDAKPSRRGEKCVFSNGDIAKRLRVSSYVVCQPRFALE